MIPWNFEAFQAIWHIQLGSGSHLTLFISGQKLPVSQKGENWKNEIREIKGVRIVRIFSYFFWIITVIVPIDKNLNFFTKIRDFGFFSVLSSVANLTGYVVIKFGFKPFIDEFGANPEYRTQKQPLINGKTRRKINFCFLKISVKIRMSIFQLKYPKNSSSANFRESQVISMYIRCCRPKI